MITTTLLTHFYPVCMHNIWLQVAREWGGGENQRHRGKVEGRERWWEERIERWKRKQTGTEKEGNRLPSQCQRCNYHYISGTKVGCFPGMTHCTAAVEMSKTPSHLCTPTKWEATFIHPPLHPPPHTCYIHSHSVPKHTMTFKWTKGGWWVRFPSPCAQDTITKHITPVCVQEDGSLYIFRKLSKLITAVSSGYHYITVLRSPRGCPFINYACYKTIYYSIYHLITTVVLSQGAFHLYGYWHGHSKNQENRKKTVHDSMCMDADMATDADSRIQNVYFDWTMQRSMPYHMG